MPQLAYVYVPSVEALHVNNVFTVLAQYGFRPARIGKNDPPRRKVESVNAAVALILTNPTQARTNWTFVADPASHIDLSFELRSDPRWSFSTVSLTFPDHISVSELCSALFQQCGAFACVGGVVGAGKDQPWAIKILSDTCPVGLRATLAGA